MVVMVGNVCAISGDQPASLATDIDLWRCSQKHYQRACERGSAEAMREGQVCWEGVLKVAVPSSELRRAMERRLTDADPATFLQELLAHSRALLNGVRDRTVKSTALHHLGGNVHLSTVCFCKGDRWDGR